MEKKIWFYQIIFNTPIYDPLLEVRDSIFVFNHVYDTVSVYDQKGVLARKFPIDHHYQTGWKNELIVDHSSEQIYAKCVRGGLAHLLQINPTTGQILKEFKLDGHIFPDKIKIRAGEAYYLHTEKKNQSVQNLYRQKLN